MAVLSLVAYARIEASRRHDWWADAQGMAHHDEVHHIIVIPTYKEPLATLQRTLRGLALQTFPHQRLHIMLSFEERAGLPAHDKAAALQAEFGTTFGHVWATHHPVIKGEVVGKSANTSWGAKLAKKFLVDEAHINIDYITISSEDADVVFDPQYYSALTYEFLKNPKRYNRIWQGSIRFYNNIWQVPAPVRVLASIFSVTQMFILMRKDRLINFSSYTISLKLVDEIGYWDTDVIPEDYRLFFKAYFAKSGDMEVEPIFLPIFADAAESTGWWSTMKNQYEQIKRWAWGVSDDAYIIRQYILARNIPVVDKTLRVLKTVEDHFLWPVNWFAITIGALLPPLLNPEFSRTIMGKTLPQVSSAIMTLSLVSLLVIFILDARSRPPRPDNRKAIWYRLMQPLEFILLPVIGFFFAALPGLDAHTRLMLGKYIEYKVTEKV
jgi:cellulose synthase/poly-beta-1,6-N-acetylglucosamine synthase-like glycosyltransferase